MRLEIFQENTSAIAVIAKKLHKLSSPHFSTRESSYVWLLISSIRDKIAIVMDRENPNPRRHIDLVIFRPTAMTTCLATFSPIIIDRKFFNSYCRMTNTLCQYDRCFTLCRLLSWAAIALLYDPVQVNKIWSLWASLQHCGDHVAERVYHANLVWSYFVSLFDRWSTACYSPL